MNILVTGCDGFIGKHVMVDLMQSGHTVVGIDVKMGEDVMVYEEKANYDVVVHLAAYIDITESFEEPDMYYLNNTIATALLAERFPNARFVFASSAAVYAENISPYGLSKRWGEKLLPADSVALRIFNPFGKGENHENETHLIPNLMKSTKKDKAVVYKGGKQVRNFIEVSDVVSAIRACIDKPTVTGAFDICSDQALSVKEVIELMDIPVKFKKEERDNGDVDILDGDNEQFKMATGWRPKIDVRKSISNWREWNEKS